MKAKSKGFSDVLYLDSVNGKYIEEVSACNIFMVKVMLINTITLNTIFTKSKEKLLGKVWFL